METKVTITNSDIESVASSKNFKGDFTNKNRKTPSIIAKALLFPLIFLFPLLCFASIIIRMAQNKKSSEQSIGWLKYCNTLLIAGGLLNIAAAVIGYEIRYDYSLQPLKKAKSNPQFVLNTKKDFIPTFSNDELKTKDLAKRVEEKIFITSKTSKWNKPSIRQLLESGFGTSFLLYANKNDCLLVTCRHVIDGEDWESEKKFKGDVALWDRKEGYATGKIIGRHKKLDLMLIHLERDPNLNEATFIQPILESNKTDLGEHVMIYGHPEGLFFSIADGLISRKDDSGIIQITAPVSPGDSGGPVYNLHGQLVGIVSSMLDKTVNKNSENLNFAIPADSIIKFDDWNLDDSGKSILQEYIQKELFDQKKNK